MPDVVAEVDEVDDVDFGLIGDSATWHHIFWNLSLGGIQIL